MKIELENVSNSSQQKLLRWLINPKLNDRFYWHFHPEFEIVFIEAEKGNRHVGEHFSHFYSSDMVMIGSNIPHLNFDYGITTNYHKTVLHISENFITPWHESLPEFKPIVDLFRNAEKGIAFGCEMKSKIGEKFKLLHTLSEFEQIIELLKILYVMAMSNDFEFLHHERPKNTVSIKEKQRLDRVVAYIQNNYTRKIQTKDVASLCNLSLEAFCRYFKQMTKLTFTEYLNNFRINESKRLLMNGYTVTEACYESGFESLSYFNRIFKKNCQENPSSFKKSVMARK